MYQYEQFFFIQKFKCMIVNILLCFFSKVVSCLELPKGVTYSPESTCFLVNSKWLTIQYGHHFTWSCCLFCSTLAPIIHIIPLP